MGPQRLLRRREPRRRALGRAASTWARSTAASSRSTRRRASRSGRRSPSTQRSPTRSPARRAWRRASSSSATAAPSSACAATCRPTTPRPARWSGASTPCPARPTSRASIPALELAAKTWPADATWESGLGGTVWDSIAYDPELDLLYVGVGNSSPYDRRVRSPGGGDNLFLASILALRADDGRAGLALPDHARRELGLHRHAAHDPRRPRDRRAHAHAC